MTLRGRGSQELSDDQLALIVVVTIAVSVVVARHKMLLAGIGRWLQQRNLVVHGPALVQIPNVGGLDAARLLILVGTLLVGAVLTRVVWRARRRQVDR